MVPDIKHLRIKTSETIASLTPYLRGDQMNKNTRELMDGLRTDCKNSQEVTTILRDRLTTLSSDLIEARSRISDLEAILTEDRQTIRSLSTEMKTSNESTRVLSQELKKVVGELRDSNTNAAELEVELANAQERVEEVEKELAKSEAISAEVPELRETIHELKSQLSNAEERATEVVKFRDEALTTQKKLSDINAENQILRVSLEQNILALNERTSSLAKLEHKISELLEDLNASQAREKGVSEARKADKATFEEATRRLESRVGSLEAELERSRESATQANMRFQALQDRFDDQTITLRLTKETNAELQERVVDVEKAASKEQGILQGQVSVLEVKCSELQASNRDLVESLERENSSVRSAETTFQQQLFAKEKEWLEAAAKEARILEESMKKVNDLTVENEKLQQEVAATKAIPPPPPIPPKDAIEDSDVVVALRADITRLQNKNEELVRKSNTIEERYKNGDLTGQEKSLVRTIRGEARVAQEQQLDMKSNELIRREKTIQARDMKIKQLEEIITRLHKHAAKIGDQSSTADKQSASDPNIPSQVSSPPVPDRDGPLLQGTPVTNRASEVGKLANRALRTPTRTAPPQEPEHPVLPRRTAMKPRGKGLIRSMTDTTDEVVDSGDEFDEPVISALGKRDRLGGPSKRTDGKRDSSFEEAERPHKNRKTKANGQNNAATKASDATVVARRRRNRN
ncbi:hypothetical protein BDM02DRAFT_3109613 [Thelephora ganbajun]|uniref:Uncharacterized protein n=1 Tax=Thelephora ganbajun TaxID=370292 RepID=A0ACB6ZRI4_THEGA|nr:hypothetical protein BDM02DRAFT_3109613 [Thelephora ganbajun]